MKKKDVLGKVREIRANRGGDVRPNGGETRKGGTVGQGQLHWLTHRDERG